MKELDEFNQKYIGKEINYCNLFWRAVNFNPEELTFCCSSTLGYTPAIACADAAVLNSFDKDYFIRATIKNISSSQDECKMGCYGCEMLHKEVFNGVRYDDIKIENIVWNHFRGCNSKCAYCGDGGKPVHVYYEPKQIVEKLFEQNSLANNVTVSYGGGEPTLVPGIDEYIEYGRKHGWKQIFNTNALCCKEYIIEALKDKNFSVQVSVDAGSPSVYQRIKGQNGFEKVWRTLKKYCETGGNVYIKYIVFSWNSAIEELDRFISEVMAAGGADISISGESNAGWGGRECEWEFGKAEIEGCAYLIEKAFENSVAVHLHRGNFSKKDSADILKTFVSEYLCSKMEDMDVYIWGMGIYGKRLADAFVLNNVSVRAFGDNASAQWGCEYHGITCVSKDTLFKNIEERKALVFIGLTDYKEVCRDLKDKENLKVCVLNLL